MFMKIPRATRSELAYQAILEKITLCADGTRLDSIKSLSEQMGVSVCTIQQAMRRLENEGLIVKKHGSGTFVAGRISAEAPGAMVPVCMAAEGHVYGELCGQLMQGLHGQERSGVLLGVNNHELLGQRLRTYAFSGAKYILVMADIHFPVSILHEKIFSKANIICILEQRRKAALSDWHGVIWDQAAAAALVCEHLWNAGHRHVLLTGTSTMVPAAIEGDSLSQPYGCAFLADWLARGGRCCFCEYAMIGDGCSWPHPEEVLGIMRGADAPTAVVSMFDVAAFALQRLMLEQVPELAERVEIIGNGNTPWSQAGHPPISSVDWNIKGIAQEACRLISLLEAGEVTEPQRILVPPKLILRSTGGEKEISSSL